MRSLKDLILEKQNSRNTITYEKFIGKLRDLGTHTIYLEDRLELIGGDYPTFKSYPGMSADYDKCVGKEFKSMTLERNSKNQMELHLNFKRSVGSITDIVITNTDDLYNCLGDEQVSILYDLIEGMVDAKWI